jgi:hypothetical protein
MSSSVTMVVGDDLSWLDSVARLPRHCWGRCQRPVGLDRVVASSDLSARVSPFSDFWKATTTHTAAWLCSGPPLVAAGQHQSYPAAAQQNSKPQVVPDAPWNFPADPAPAGPSQPVNLVVGAQQDWLCPAGEHAAPPSLLFSPGAPLPFPSPVVTAAPARLV